MQVLDDLKFRPDGGAMKSQFSLFILTVTWMSDEIFMAIHPIRTVQIKTKNVNRMLV